jgi:predicted secreted Zn-dependent protease
MTAQAKHRRAICGSDSHLRARRSPTDCEQMKRVISEQMKRVISEQRTDEASHQRTDEASHQRRVASKSGNSMTSFASYDAIRRNQAQSGAIRRNQA